MRPRRRHAVEKEELFFIFRLGVGVGVDREFSGRLMAVDWNDRGFD